MCPSRIGMCVDGIAISASVYFKVLLLVTSTKSTPLSCILYLLLQIHLLLLLQNFVNASGRSFISTGNHHDHSSHCIFMMISGLVVHFFPKWGMQLDLHWRLTLTMHMFPPWAMWNIFSQLVCSTDCTAASRYLNNAVSPSQWSHCSTITKS